MPPAFQNVLPLRSFCLRVSGAVAPSAPAEGPHSTESALPISPTGFFGRGEPSRSRENVNSRSQYETQYENGHRQPVPIPRPNAGRTRAWPADAERVIDAAVARAPSASLAGRQLNLAAGPLRGDGENPFRQARMDPATAFAHRPSCESRTRRAGRERTGSKQAGLDANAAGSRTSRNTSTPAGDSSIIISLGGIGNLCGYVTGREACLQSNLVPSVGLSVELPATMQRRRS